MSQVTEHLTDMSAFEDALRDRICHWYPRDPRYRRSGAPHAQIGDIAYCGHVKDSPPWSSAEVASASDCAACLRLMEINRGR